MIFLEDLFGMERDKDYIVKESERRLRELLGDELYEWLERETREKGDEE